MSSPALHQLQFWLYMLDETIAAPIWGGLQVVLLI
jgi:hypothetical protein